jgi:hypothetical protein
MSEKRKTCKNFAQKKKKNAKNNKGRKSELEFSLASKDHGIGFFATCLPQDRNGRSSDLIAWQKTLVFLSEK